MERALSEWQCDARGIWFDPNDAADAARVGLGARVLYTTPEAQRERVPFIHPQFPHLVLAADAWLDNRAELCDALGVPPSERATACDSELILCAYAKWGEACAAKLHGDFAFALWDAQNARWYCARDFMGCKPFFYFAAPSLFCCASDVRAVLACPNAPNVLDEAMLAAYLVQSTIAAEKRHTFYRDVWKLPPAHYLVVTRDAARLTRYWSPADAPAVRLASPDAYADQARALLERATQNATRTLFRVGAHLSGGLDSTAIAILAARQLRARGERMNGYSWSPPLTHTQIQTDADERAFIEMVCAQEGITPRYLEYSDAAALQIYTRDVTRIPREMALREEQTQNMAARDKTRVLLSGWGGDELLSYSGRGYLAELFWRGQWGALDNQIKKRIPAAARGARWLRAYGGILRGQVLWQLMPDWVWRLSSPYQAPTRYPQYIDPDFYRRHRAALRALQDPLPRDYPGVRATQLARLEHGHLTRRIESWAMHGAARGLVYRYPLLDRELVEFVLGLPPELYFADGRSRAVFRGAARGILPETFRATRDKSEPVAVEVVGAVLEQAVLTLYAKTRPLFAKHRAARYVNVAAIQAQVESQNIPLLELTPLLHALSCFYLDL